MIINGGLIDPCPRDDGADAGAVVAALGEQPLGRFHDSIARDLGRSSHHRPLFFKPVFEITHKALSGGKQSLRGRTA
jgi:hypothetical protein